MSQLTASQWRLVLGAACAECSMCGGDGEVMRCQRQKRPSGRYRTRARIRYVRCPRCKFWRWLLDELAPD